EPDAAVIPGAIEDYDREHPRAALLVAEVSDSSLKQDRLTKGAIYAAAGIPEYWIVNLRDDCVEVRRQPEPEKRRYASIAIAGRGPPLAAGSRRAFSSPSFTPRGVSSGARARPSAIKRAVS